ncbi:MAG: DJ-1/PfpI family protein [Sphingomonadales bacterium]
MTLRFGILVFPKVQQLDLTGPYEVFASAKGTEVDLVWKDLEPITTATGLKLLPTATFEDSSQYDVLCVPGGGGVNPLLKDKEVLEYVRKQAAGAKYITSVCTGSLILGAAGLLKGRRATSHWYAIDFLSHLGAEIVDERVVQDGNIFTAGGVTSGIDFGLAVIAELMGREEAEAVQLALEYAPAPPMNAGTPKGASAKVLASAKERIGASRAEREKIFSNWP